MLHLPLTRLLLVVVLGAMVLRAPAIHEVPFSATASAATITLLRGPYLQQPTDRSIVVVWATREPGSAEVRYGVSSGTARTTVPAISRLVPAADTGLGFDYYHHAAILGGLSPGTSYAYRPFVAGSPLAAEAMFKTAPQKGSGAISFIAFGDSGTGSLEQRELGGVMSRDTFDFVMHVGDIVYGNSGGTGAATYATYQSYLFDIYGWFPSKPFVPVEGNHDSRPSNGDGKAFLDLFELPRNGATASFPDHAERYYSFDYGPVHFVALDTEFTFLDPVRQAEQLRWLAADLSATTQPWTIAFLHRAPYSSGGENGSSPDVRAAFGPLFERYGVDLVLSSHEHDYERTVPIRESSTPTDQFVTYVVSGGGGAPLYPSGTSNWTAYSASRHEYVKVAVDACTLSIEAIGLDGAVFDSSSTARCVPGNASPSVTVTTPTTGTHFTAPATIPISAWPADSDGTIAKVDFYAGGTLIGTRTAEPYSIFWVQPAAGVYALTAVATDNDGASTLSSGVSVTVDPANPSTGTLPVGWTRADIGNTGVAGNATGADGSFTVTGAGADVWGTADALHYAYRTLDGDGTIVARVTAIENVHAWTKVGVMIRNSLSPGAAQAFMLVAASPLKGVPFQRRPSDGGLSVSSSGSQSTAPRWVKLVRTGNVITGYESANGSTWTAVGSDTFTMGRTVLIGVGVSSHITGVNATATFDNVTVTAATVPPPANLPPTSSLSSPTAGSRFTAPAQIGLAANANDSDGTVSKVDFYAGTTLIGTDSSAPYSITWSNVPAGSYALRAVAIDNANASTTSSAVSITVDPANPPPTTLPAGWSLADIGNTGITGNATGAAGTFTVTGAGADVWGTADALHFAYRTLDGDGTIIARVATIQNINAWTKVGVMIRNSLSPGSAQAFMLVAASPLKGVAFQRRPSDGSPSISTSGSQSTAPRWVKLVRTGNVITGYESINGSTWATVGSDTFTMGKTVLIGLGVSSHVTAVNATANFDNVSVTSDPPSPVPGTLPEGWGHADIGNTGAVGDATSAGGTFTVTGAGADVWGTADALHYVYRMLDGDGTIVARVTTIENINAWTKVGVMIRNSLSPGAAQGFMLVAASPLKGVPFQRRRVDGSSSVSTSGSQSSAPRWVKLVRTGSLITGYESADGTTWTAVGSDTFTMGATVLIGLGVSSHVTGVNASATFDNVTVTPATASRLPNP